MILKNITFFAFQGPLPPPPPPGLAIDKGIIYLMFSAVALGLYVLVTKNKKESTIQEIEESNKQNYTILVPSTAKVDYWNRLRLLVLKVKKIVSTSFLALVFTLTPIEETPAQGGNSWSVGAGASNFIMHGDLRSIGTGNQGNFWNFGGYLSINKMFNPVLGLELKFNYNNISGGAQDFSDIYEILYVSGQRIMKDLFFAGKAFGSELNMMLSFSNLIKREAKRMHFAGYFGLGYHLYDSKLYKKHPDGTRDLLIDFGHNPARSNVFLASSIYFSMQLGIRYKLSRRLDIEFRPSLYFNNEDHLDATISDKQVWESFFVSHLGLVVKLGKNKSHLIWQDQENDHPTDLLFSLTDSDRDGVMDKFDVEPNTPKGVQVYGNGQAIDTDKDGLPDHIDDCPLKKGAKENNGCPILKDSDKDGLMDPDDLCPLQPGSPKNKGCPKLKDNNRVTLIKYISELAANVYFHTAKWDLTAESKKVLDQIAKYIEEVPNIKFKVEGHTDNRDRNSFNMLLSQKRADAVVKYLRKRGIDEKRLSYKGYGETRPLYSNETPQGRQLNRRVEIKPEKEIEYDPIKTHDNTKSSVHVVKQGDTLFSIAELYGISVQKLKQLNNLTSNIIAIGQELTVKE